MWWAKFELDWLKQFIPASDHAITHTVNHAKIEERRIREKKKEGGEEEKEEKK